MKKLALFVVLGFILTSILGGCGTKSVAGTTWALDGGEYQGHEISREEMEDTYGEILYMFRSDNVVTVSVDGMTDEGTWTQDGKTVTIGGIGSLELKGNKLIMEDSESTIVFKKK
ncbi:MAG: hypothetical protein EOM34_16795 [Clostridia bacterium]|nr:hypothetical protein [Lachnospiraceae bacterium]NCC02277.1 hypothetical protein [Clostridia bacterium]NCD03916.1 hypothetical protein [Clostridia bacterium]